MRILAFALTLVLCFYSSLFWSFQVKELPWKTENPSTTKRFEGLSALVGSNLFLFFGFEEYHAHSHGLIGSSHVSLLDTDSMTWKRLNDAPFTGTHLSSSVDGELVYFVGGFEGNHPGPAVDNFLIYNTQDDTWKFGPAIPQKIGGGVLGKLENKLHFVSGYFSPVPEPSSDKHWVLDLSNQEQGWIEAAPIPISRGHAGAAVLNNKLYMIGGAYTHDPMWEDTDLVHRYDPKSDSWKQVASLPYKLSHIEPGTFVYNGRIIVAGGRNGGTKSLSERELQDIIAYDPVEDRWEFVGTLPLRLRSPAVRVVNEKILVTTGSTYWGQEPTDKTWSIDCSETKICSGEGDVAKLRLRTFFKGVAILLPHKVQNALHLKSVALPELRD